jgi:hypothetical protein
MRLWTLHPGYLDTKGLVAVWREALLAQAVLRGRTRGYRRHPQLARFRSAAAPVAAIAAYLREIQREGARRGFDLDARRIARGRSAVSCRATRGQLTFEWSHLMRKLKTRDPERFAELSSIRQPRPHPLFRVVAGGVESWEKGPGPRPR